MIAINLRTLCVALGFLAVIMKDGKVQRNNANRALAIALLMEAFCVAHGPEAARFPPCCSRPRRLEPRNTKTASANRQR